MTEEHIVKIELEIREVQLIVKLLRSEATRKVVSDTHYDLLRKLQAIKVSDFLTIYSIT